MNATIKLPSPQIRHLRSLLDDPPVGLPPPAADSLRRILDRVTPEEPGGGHAGLGCRVRLVSPDNPKDTLEFEPVMPVRENLDDDRISVARPVCLAVLGQPEGAVVEWSLGEENHRMILHEVRPPVETDDR